MTEKLLSRRRLLTVAGSTAAVGLAGCSSSDDSAEEETTTGGDSGTATDTESVTPALSVADTETEDRTLTVPSATLDAAGWLVIHPEAQSGGPNGAVVLGAEQLSAGEHSDIEIEVSSLVAGEQTLYAMLHYDDPQDGELTFPANGDPPVTVDDAPVVEPFSVTLTGEITPSLSVTDQPTTGETVTVPGAAIDETGWLVIHPAADGGGPDGGTTFATIPVEAGLYSDVVVPLDEPLTESQTLYAMLHYEDPADGEFGFPNNGDPAVTANGSPVLEPFEATVQAAGGSGEDGMETPTETVSLTNSTFDPKRLSVDPGTTVEWVNDDSYGHDVTSAQFHDVAESWDYSESLSAEGATVSHTFESEGIYEYVCTIHGKANMCGVVLVGDVSLDADLPCESSSGGY